MMSEKIQFQLEYNFNTSHRLLFERIGTAAGYVGWFADEVIVTDGKLFNFVWDKAPHHARLINKKEGKLVRYHWVDDNEDCTFFELRMEIQDLTNEVALIITDFASPEEKEEAIEMWQYLITKLRHIIGS